ncbi:hypothetical protein O181_083808 [Austropuccinia psidii MF-1]|uniref:Integrase catalytic domain-containing protein n=1 Tax=Austropuccinia psidii MF-1 TaxID=1389203 RepID=A0A9Q3FUD7_9BASI|nr:hypothetical protein [Austropuccinia psidii MF-1]
MIKIQEPRRAWEIVHMYWVTGLPLGGDRGYNACLVIVDRFSKTPIFLPCRKDDTAMDTALLIWNRVISWTGIFPNVISDRDPKFPQHYGLIFTNYLKQNYPSLQTTTQKLMGLEFKYCDGFTHDRCNLLPALYLAYKTSIHASTNQIPAIVEKGWNSKLPQDSFRKELVEIHTTSASFKGMLKNAIKHAVRCMEDSFAYAKEKWDK